jgi:membrane complex biogenesis BtpA family protein
MDLFDIHYPIIGMVHLLPLPGSPRFSGIQQIITQAQSDINTLVNNDIDGILIENFGDVPYTKSTVPPHTVAWMTSIINSLDIDIPFGVNVLRNDCVSALAIAHAVNGSFIRCNILTGVMATDQGIIEGDAARVQQYRSYLDIPVHIFADILVKYAAPMGDYSLEQAAHDTVFRGLADAVIVTGSRTGSPPDIHDLKKVTHTIPDTFVFAGSGVTADNVQSILEYAHGCIIGKAFKKEGKIENPVEEKKVKTLMKKVKEIR